MNFSFSGRHMEIGESLTNKAKELLQSLETKYRLEFLDANIVMNKDGYQFITDISVKTNTGNSYMITEKAEDPKVSFDIAIQKLAQQMQKKKKARCCACGKDKDFEVMASVSDHDEGECEGGLIIAEVLDDLPLMSVSEAAEHLNEKRKVFIFENIVNSAVNVVYKRCDGNIGWIDYKHEK